MSGNFFSTGEQLFDAQKNFCRQVNIFNQFAQEIYLNYNWCYKNQCGKACEVIVEKEKIFLSAIGYIFAV